MSPTNDALVTPAGSHVTELGGRLVHLRGRARRGPPVLLLGGCAVPSYAFGAVVTALPGRWLVTLDRPGMLDTPVARPPADPGRGGRDAARALPGRRRAARGRRALDGRPARRGAGPRAPGLGARAGAAGREHRGRREAAASGDGAGVAGRVPRRPGGRPPPAVRRRRLPRDPGGGLVAEPAAAPHLRPARPGPASSSAARTPWPASWRSRPRTRPSSPTCRTCSRRRRGRAPRPSS